MVVEIMFSAFVGKINICVVPVNVLMASDICSVKRIAQNSAICYRPHHRSYNANTNSRGKSKAELTSNTYRFC